MIYRNETKISYLIVLVVILVLFDLDCVKFYKKIVRHEFPEPELLKSCLNFDLVYAYLDVKNEFPDPQLVE